MNTNNDYTLYAACARQSFDHPVLIETLHNSYSEKFQGSLSLFLSKKRLNNVENCISRWCDVVGPMAMQIYSSLFTSMVDTNTTQTQQKRECWLAVSRQQ